MVKVTDHIEGIRDMKNDLVSRRAAIDIVRFECGEWEGLAKTIIKRFEDLPAAQPERKRGKWIYNSPVTMKCNQCGLVIKDWDWHRFKYCPHCGADMREVDDERFD